MRDDDGSEVFVHRSSVRRRDRNLVAGEAVRFAVLDGPERDSAV